MPKRDDIKQVIIFRRDLKMDKGKLASQAAHAGGWFPTCVAQGLLKGCPESDMSEAETIWIKGQCQGSRVMLWADDEDHLFRLEKQAIDLGLHTAVFEDQGRTQFHGTPTITTLVIAPAFKDVVDKITSDLKLV